MCSFDSVWLAYVKIVDSVIKFCHFRKANTGFVAKLCIWNNNHSWWESTSELSSICLYTRSYVERNVRVIEWRSAISSSAFSIMGFILIPVNSLSISLSLPLFSLLSSFFLLLCSGYPIYFPLSYVHAFVSIVHDRVYTGRSMGVNSFLWWL